VRGSASAAGDPANCAACRVKTGRTLTPGELQVVGERISEARLSVAHPGGAEIIDLGDRTLLPGFIDAHIHLFLHPGAEDLQTVQESVPRRTLAAILAAREGLMAGFTAERDMGTEGAGSADAQRDRPGAVSRAPAACQWQRHRHSGRT
jgi:imidazolonepropionase-like amidohydrolase